MIDALFLSDTHLSYFDATRDRKKLDWLLSTIHNAKRVWLVGDFWDGKRIGFNEFIKTRWNVLFAPLKKRRTVYVYGNHDTERLQPSNHKLFYEKSGEFVTSTIQGARYIFYHGHQLDSVAKREEWLEGITGMMVKPFARKVDEIIVDSRWLRGMKKWYKSWNDEQKMQIARFRPTPTTFTILGHSHIPEIDQQHLYANIGGFPWNTFTSYMTVEYGVLHLRQEYL